MPHSVLLENHCLRLMKAKMLSKSLCQSTWFLTYCLQNYSEALKNMDWKNKLSVWNKVISVLQEE